MMRLWRKEVVNDFQLNQFKQVFFFFFGVQGRCVALCESIILWLCHILTYVTADDVNPFPEKKVSGCKSLNAWMTRQWRHSWLTHQFTINFWLHLKSNQVSSKFVSDDGFLLHHIFCHRGAVGYPERRQWGTQLGRGPRTPRSYRWSKPSRALTSSCLTRA